MFDPTAASKALTTLADDEEVILSAVAGERFLHVTELSVGGCSVTWLYDTDSEFSMPYLFARRSRHGMQVSHAEFSKAVDLMAERCPTETVVLSMDRYGFTMAADLEGDKFGKAVTIRGEWLSTTECEDWTAKVSVRDLCYSVRNPTSDDSLTLMPISRSNTELCAIYNFDPLAKLPHSIFNGDFFMYVLREHVPTKDDTEKEKLK